MFHNSQHINLSSPWLGLFFRLILDVSVSLFVKPTCPSIVVKVKCESLKTGLGIKWGLNKDTFLFIHVATSYIFGRMRWISF